MGKLTIKTVWLFCILIGIFWLSMPNVYGKVQKFEKYPISYNPSCTNKAIPEEFTNIEKVPDTEVLWPVNIKGKWGFIDKEGKIVVKPKYSSAGFFSEGLAGVARGRVAYSEGKWGFIDITGREVIKPKYYSASSFREGLSEIRGRDYLYWGYMDKTGKVVIPPQFKGRQTCASYDTDFNEGLAMVFDSHDRCGYVNKKGKYVISSKYEECLGFQEGLALVYRNEKPHYIDHNGCEVLSFPKGYWVWPFSEGLAAVNTGKALQYIDKKGHLILEFLGKHDFIGSFSEGLAAVQVKGKIGYVDKKGKFVIKPQYDRATSFSEGLAAVGNYSKKGNLRVGFIDRDGKMVIKPQFNGAPNCAEESELPQFKNGIAQVYIGDTVCGGEKMGYIDKTGKYIWKPR